jgi:general stress protein YciG
MPENNNKGGSQGSGRGFASMDEDKQREIASQGGRAAHESGNAHEFDSEEAREAGSKGGQARGDKQGISEQGGGTRGGSSEQHAQAGSQSHKND